MSHECAKAMIRRLHQPLFHQRVFVGRGLDVGSGDDSLAKYAYMFPRIAWIDSWDKEHGDGQELFAVADGVYDFVHSSHSLEHMEEPRRALRRWYEVVRPMGHIVITVPDMDLYEHQEWPSRFNADHKWCFTLGDTHVGNVISIPYLLKTSCLNVKLVRAELIESTFDLAALKSVDQTLGHVAECAIEIVLRKMS